MIIERPNPNGDIYDKSQKPWRLIPNQPSRIIVHGMGEIITGMPAAEFLESVGLSAHALVTPSGDIIRCRNDAQTASHAKGFNVDTLGIEFLVPGEHDIASLYRAMDQPGWVSEEQLLAGARWIAEWMARWGITQIDGHSDVDPDRKRDPGRGFDWDKLRAAL